MAKISQKKLNMFDEITNHYNSVVRAYHNVLMAKVHNDNGSFDGAMRDLDYELYSLRKTMNPEYEEFINKAVSGDE